LFVLRLVTEESLWSYGLFNMLIGYN